MSIADDIRTYAENALEEAKKAAEEGRKPFYALVGLNDLALEQTRQFAEKAQAQIDDYRENMTDRIANFRAEFEKTMAEGRQKAQELPKLLSSLDFNDVQKAVQDYAANVQKFYESLTERGEKLVGELTQQASENPVIKRLIEASEQSREQTVALIQRGQTAAKDAQARAQAAFEDASKAAQAASQRTRKAAEAVVEDAAKVAKSAAARTREVAEENAEDLREAAGEIRDDLTTDPVRRQAGKKAAETRAANEKARSDAAKKAARTRAANAAKAPAKKAAKKAAPKKS